MAKLEVDLELISKYNQPGPRYTSYPTAPHFSESVTWPSLLELVRAIESESAPEIRAAADAAFVEPLEINRALLKTLFLAGALDRSRIASGR